MNLTRLAISNPVAVIAAILLVLVMGTIAMLSLPIQMIPDVQRSFIQISTGWRSAAPEEVESEIVEPQEDVLRGVPGLEKMESSATRGNANINLMFSVGTDLQRALIEVINRLNQVPRYPNDVTEPRIFAGQDSFGEQIAWFSLTRVPGNERPMASYEDFVREVVQARIERVPGVSNSNAYGGRANEVRITFDPYEAAALGIDIPTLAGQTGNNNDTSGGFSDVGRRKYTLRYAGKYDLPEFGDMVLDWRGGNPVRLRDIATVAVTMRDEDGFMMESSHDAITFDTQVEQGVNVLDVMRKLKAAIEELKEGPLAREGLQIRQVYDESTYIEDSIAMLRTNLLLGIGLAISILWWFMRRLRATFLVALAIPISLFTSFVILQITGRTLNMISLAGLAFATGMVLDAAIVVLENIVRLKEKGVPTDEAALQGSGQVWPALLASTATTVIIFLPIIFLQDVSGQLFADLALVISVAVLASLTIAVSVIPTGAATWLEGVRLEDPHTSWWERATETIMRVTNGRRVRFALIGGIFLGATLLTWLLVPPANYLPEGKQGWVFAFIDRPPGQSVSIARDEFAAPVVERLQPYLKEDAEIAIKSYFMGVFGSFAFAGASMVDPDDAETFVHTLNSDILAGFPDTMAYADEWGIFDRLGGGSSIELNIQSRDMDAMLTAARKGMELVGQHLPGARARPIPGVDFAEPELRFIPDERRITEAGWTRRDMSTVMRALGDGVYVGDYFDGDRRMDIVLRSPEWTSPEQLAATPLATPIGGIQSVDQLVRMQRTAGPNQVRRVDRRRAVTLAITPPADISLEESIDLLRSNVEPALLRMLPEDGEISYYGSADDLNIALAGMSRSFALAIVVLYLLMSALFRSFVDSLLVVAALPLATVGGVSLLRIMNLPMDLLTMIGFITLLGLVVNNAILLVHQTRSAEREGLDRRSAVEQAIRRRLRPILMTTLTSIFGMSPLLLIPGPGSEVYQGLAAVIVGGMSVSALFTLILLPSLLRLGEDANAPASILTPAGATP
ncbi:MAG: efflux RND transporter permease subunit [Gammaproteobacteria bacterium]|nr:efflux RND transporter permease subunit [Gammaproteobacteria bacterium]MBT8112023.1 efflux RND transporter permease subunit [Gammaproteobacteria bacterium]NND48116.1 efflux RND transporter permease subunit [Woeseiaceae bacterium]NNL46724.1 efflux RND transporter permease subunit [Woeseiaceae bacterium]